MISFPPGRQALSPGFSLILWKGRLAQGDSHPVPRTEILSRNYAGVTLDFQQRKGHFLYDREGRSPLPVQKGFFIDRYA